MNVSAPKLSHQRFVLRPRHGDHAQSGVDAELDRVAADRARRAGDAERLPRLEREPIQREAHREPVHRQRGGGFQAGALGHAGDGRGRNDDRLGLRATAGPPRIDDRHHAVTDAPLRALADGVHDAGQLHPGDVGRMHAHLGELRGRELSSAAEADVGRVDRRRRDANAYLAGAGLRLRQRPAPRAPRGHQVVRTSPLAWSLLVTSARPAWSRWRAIR